MITNLPGPKVNEEDLILREDDKPKKIELRFKEYKKDTAPLVEYLEKLGILIQVNGERPIDVIFEDIMSQLKKKNLS